MDISFITTFCIIQSLIDQCAIYFPFLMKLASTHPPTTPTIPPIAQPASRSRSLPMCGIVAGVSTRNIVPILVEGLKRLEYRGYDSCGVAVHQDGALRRTRSTARVAELQEQIASDHVQ